MEIQSSRAGKVKARAVAALRYLHKRIIKRAGKAVWQHHALYINRDGVELIPFKWYHTDETFTEIFGPFDTQLDACIACNQYAEQFLGPYAESEVQTETGLGLRADPEGAEEMECLIV